MSSVDSIPFKRCSHISMGVLILLIIEIVMLTLFQPVCFPSSGSDLFNIRKINSKFSHRCLFHPFHVAFVFPAHPPFSSRTRISYSSILLLIGSLSILFLQCSYPVILMKILTEFQVRLSSLIFFSGGSNSVLFRFFSVFQMFSHTGAPHNNSLLSIHLFASAEVFSKGSSCHSRSAQPISRLLSHSRHLFQSVHFLFQIPQQYFF